MSNEIALRGAATDLTIEPEQAGFTSVQVAALKQMGLDDAPDEHLQVLFHQAKRTGLDPFAKQIYMIARKSKNGTQYTIQTGIDGFRVTGHRTADKRGDSVSMSEPLWYHPEAGWQDVWFDRRPPAAAKATITVTRADGRVETFTSTANYAEFVQTTKDYNSGNQVPNSMWAKMPANQLAKCAESACWRKAYPWDFSGLVLEDARQVIDGEYVERPPTAARRTVAEVLATPATPAAEPMAPEERPEPMPPMSTLPQQKKLAILLGEAGVTDRAAKLAYLKEQFKRDFTTSKQLTRDEISGLIDFLESSGQPDEPDQPTSDGAQA